MNIGIVSYSYPFSFKDGKKCVCSVIDVLEGKKSGMQTKVFSSPEWFKAHPLNHGDEVSLWYDRDKGKYTSARRLVIE